MAYFAVTTSLAISCEGAIRGTLIKCSVIEMLSLLQNTQLKSMVAGFVGWRRKQEKEEKKQQV
jgi:hypothetical protein